MPDKKSFRSPNGRIYAEQTIESVSVVSSILDKDQDQEEIPEIVLNQYNNSNYIANMNELNNLPPLGDDLQMLFSQLMSAPLDGESSDEEYPKLFKLFSIALRIGTFLYNYKYAISNVSIGGVIVTQYYHKKIDRFMKNRLFLARWMYSLFRGGLFVIVAIRILPLLIKLYNSWKRWKSDRRRFTSQDFLNKPI